MEAALVKRLLLLIIKYQCLWTWSVRAGLALHSIDLSRIWRTRWCCRVAKLYFVTAPLSNVLKALICCSDCTKYCESDSQGVHDMKRVFSWTPTPPGWKVFSLKKARHLRNVLEFWLPLWHWQRRFNSARSVSLRSPIDILIHFLLLLVTYFCKDSKSRSCDTRKFWSKTCQSSLSLSLSLSLSVSLSS